MKTKHYNIHDIFRFTINNTKKCRFFDEFNSDFSYFEVDENLSPNMVINIGHFSPQNENCYIVDHKYNIKNNYFYCKDYAGMFEWEAEIFGFEYGKIIINFNYWSKLKILNLCMPIHIFLLEGMIMYALANMGYYIIHAAAVSKNNKAIIFAGRGGSFKTSLVMDFLRKLNYQYMSDDKIILHNNNAYSFPLNFKRFNFMLENMKTENYSNILEKFKLIKYIFTNNNMNINSEVVCNKSFIEQFLFVTKKNTHAFEINKIIGSKNIIKKLIESNRLELILYGSHLPSLTKIKTNPFYRYMLEYSFIYPESKIARYWETLESGLSEILNYNEIPEIEMPYYDFNTFQQIEKYIV